ncbi:MAG: hypothetical protein SF069_07965 [Phycisphaerae bacterium]|nr:hypothetical protein [Phycisphaerae bacterium]
MRSVLKSKKSLCLVALAAGMSFGAAGNCLPDNFFSDLVGGLVTDSIGSVVGQAIDSILAGAAGAAEAA